MLKTMLHFKKYVTSCYLCVLCFISSIYCSKEKVAVVDDTFGDQIKNLRYYELINPVEFSSAHLKNDSLKKKYFQINAFGREYEIVIETLYEPQTDGVQFEYVGRNNSIQGKLFKDIGCIYSGPSATNHSLKLVLNHCEGLEGFIQSEDETLFIEPLKYFSPLKPFHRKHIIYRSTDVIRPNVGKDSEDRDAVDAPPVSPYQNSTNRRVRRSGFESFLTIINRSKRRIQLYYIDSFNREIPFIMLLVNERRGVNTFEGTVWLAKDDKTNTLLQINGRERYTTRRNSIQRRTELVVTRPGGVTFDNEDEDNQVSGSEHYIEVLVVADESVVNFHGKGKVEKYLMTMMNIAAYVMKDKSLGVTINMEVVKVVLLESDERGFTVYTKRPRQTLVSACNYISSQKNANENHPDHFDIGIVITRKDFGPSGYAQLYSMCSRKRSCALVQDEGLTSSFIVAHETAHLLGLDHDGEGESSDCEADGSRGSVMAPLIVARYDRFHWSKCSREVIKENLEYFDCLRNHPRDKIKNRNKELPGALYTLDEQCQFNFDKYSSKCTAFSFDPCRILWCRGDTARRCITMRGPALDGSVCARNKHCQKGKCVEMDNHTRKKEERIVVHGKWSSWTTWTGCSQSCGIGVRHRQRFCNDPPPGPGGNRCTGESKETDICSTKDCTISKSSQTLLKEQCQQYRTGWTRYFDGDFNKMLKQPRKSLNCTFEEGLCNWEDGNTQIAWTLHEGATPSFRTGPEGDHTTADGKGKYIYLEASSTNQETKQEGHVARLVSPTVQAPRVCFGLYYHMWGEDMGALNVNIWFSNGTKLNKWSTSGNKGNRWLKLQLSIESPLDYQIVVEAVRGTHWAGDIAIDDLTIVSGVCPSDIQDPVNTCKVSCRSRSAQSFKMNINATDGIKCGNQRSNDICLNGECVRFGCDNKFDSKLKFDDCGVCGGNGSSCIKRTGRKTLELQRDYEVLVTLHKGSTFINLTEVSPRAHYFGIRKKSNNGVYLSTKFEDYYNIEGTTFHFKKGVSGQQEILSKGPTNNDLDVVVYSFKKSRKNAVIVDYEYFEPSEASRTYRYIADGWQSCSQTCGTGKQKSNIKCVREDDGEVVKETFCSHLQKPLKIRVCNLRPCVRNFVWVVRPWNKCSKTCGGGEQQRYVPCVRKYDRAIAPNRYCRTVRPVRTRVCNKNPCPKSYVWKSREWTSCSATCGGGFKTRIVTCIEENTGLVTQEDRCKQAKPDTMEPCGMVECETFVWKVNHVGMCSVSCGGGIQLRIINCVKENDRNAIVSNQYCDGPSPLRILKCNRQACPEYVWKVSVEQSPCSVTCGRGISTRAVKCVDKVSRKAVADGNCKQTKPDEHLECNEKPCTRHSIAYGEWGKCDALCGPGTQRRQFYCMTEDRKTFVDSKFCQGQQKLDSRSCQLNKCSNPADLDCDFESRDTCNWNTIGNDDFDWTVARLTPSLNTGPLTDHTRRNGYFAYIEASRPRNEGDRSILTSPYLRTTNGCLVFWYHMMGANIGRLRLYLASNSTSKVVFEKKGHISRRWMFQKVELNLVTTPFVNSGYQFIFEGTVGNGAYGDIALDDIKFYSRPCNQSNIIYNPIVQNCREISPLCSHRLKRQYCEDSSAYRMLCCKTCAEFILKTKKIL